MSNLTNFLLSLKDMALKHYWLIALIAMYIPSLMFMADSVWTSDEQAHGPIVVLIVMYLFWQSKDALIANELIPAKDRRPVLGWILIGLALIFYIVGRSQKIIPLDIGSIIFLISGISLLKGGFKAIKAIWFPIFFILFLIPIPGFVISAITLPMKIAVSIVAEKIVYLFDYPVARTGVLIQIGQYQMLVADACAGLHTLISLEAIGLLYLNLVKHQSLMRNITLALMIIPISFTANVIRVITLILVTYHFGNAAGQGFIHGFSGMLLYTVALVLIISLDGLLRKASKYFNSGASLNESK